MFYHLMCAPFYVCLCVCVCVHKCTNYVLFRCKIIVAILHIWNNLDTQLHLPFFSSQCKHQILILMAFQIISSHSFSYKELFDIRHWDLVPSKRCLLALPKIDRHTQKVFWSNLKTITYMLWVTLNLCYFLALWAVTESMSSPFITQTIVPTKIEETSKFCSEL